MNKIRLHTLLLLISLLFPCLLAGSSSAYSSVVFGDCIRGNGNMKSTERDVAKFDILDVAGAFNVTVVAGESQQTISIVADENLLPHIATSLQGNRLAIYPAKPICTENTITVAITLRTLKGLITSGSDEVKVSGINNSSFSLIQGGSSDIELEGNTSKFDVEISGAGDLEAQLLKSEKTVLRLTGSSTANVHASEELEVHITGVADVNYFGNPKKVIKDIVGVGDVNKME